MFGSGMGQFPNSNKPYKISCLAHTGNCGCLRLRPALNKINKESIQQWRFQPPSFAPV